MKKVLLAVFVCLVSCSVIGCTWETFSEGVSQTSDGWNWNGCHPDYPFCGNVNVDQDGIDGDFDVDIPEDD